MTSNTFIEANELAKVRENFRVELKRLRQTGITQTRIAQQLGMTQGAISQFATGETKLPLDFIMRFCTMFNIQPKTILGKELAKLTESKKYNTQQFYILALQQTDPDKTPIKNQVKFGISNNTYDRVREINVSKPFYHHEIARIYDFEKGGIACAVEQRFLDYCDSPLGEYLNISLEEAFEMADEAIAGLSAAKVIEPEMREGSFH